MIIQLRIQWWNTWYHVMNMGKSSGQQGIGGGDEWKSGCKLAGDGYCSAYFGSFGTKT